MVLSNTLCVYRNLLKLAKSMPSSQRINGIKQIKEGFRSGKNEHNPVAVKDMLEKVTT